MGRLSSVLNYIFLIAKKVTDDNICVLSLGRVSYLGKAFPYS